MIRPRFLALVAAAGVMMSAAAFAQQAYTNRTANVRAGPARDFPLVASLAPGTPVNIDGCVSDYLWCDVDFGNGRGWVTARSLQTYYQNRVVPLYGYGPTLGLPLITFSLFNYWDRNYRDRPFYRDRPRYEPRWAGHDRPHRDFDRPDREYNRPRPENRPPRVEDRPPRYGQPRPYADRPVVDQRRPNHQQPNTPQVQQPRQERPQAQQPRQERPRQQTGAEMQGQ